MEYEDFRPMNSLFDLKRREFLRITCALGLGLMMGGEPLAAWAEENKSAAATERIRTNIDEALSVPRTEYSLPGLFPGRVVEVSDSGAMKDDRPQAEVIRRMFEKGLESLTGKSAKESFPLFFNPEDIVGIKVNPVGAGLISTRLEVVDAVIGWLMENGIQGKNIIIWDRFDFMLEEAGFTRERYPEITVEALQTMATGDNKNFDTTLDGSGIHVSSGNFDIDVYYWADVEGPKDKEYQNMHVFNGKCSYFGKLLSRRVTKLINIPVFKNTGNGISMATKNMGYGSICNTNRLHKSLFFNVNTEVMAFPAIRDKLVLNITDGIRAQYDGGPMPVAKFTWPYNTLFFATDPFALDTICHQLMVEKRKRMDIKVNEHPVFTEYLRYAQKLGLGITNRDRITHVKIKTDEEKPS